MRRKSVFTPSISSASTLSSYTPETKSDIISFAIDLLGMEDAKLFTKRHNSELQRCSQFYSLASLFHETTTKDKHRLNGRDVQKLASTNEIIVFEVSVDCFLMSHCQSQSVLIDDDFMLHEKFRL
ncbi:unnamed protein product [Adineta ricciae]|uniref:Uncharacterized protein n=1 Tax=Adineta ricciae TaxID=249248 RepID=A0A815GQA9_ADIRI|nr:unnamed protein product [Adineta ricciae]